MVGPVEIIGALIGILVSLFFVFVAVDSWRSLVHIDDQTKALAANTLRTAMAVEQQQAALVRIAEACELVAVQQNEGGEDGLPPSV